jgi:hypothetical protein
MTDENLFIVNIENASRICMTRSFMVCAPQKIFFGSSNLG